MGAEAVLKYSMKIALVDLTVQYQNIHAELDEAVREVLAGGAFILGDRVRRIEEAVAAYLGVKHAVAVASGSDALWLSLRALGIGPGDEVIVPAYTFFATAEAVSHAGATPVWVDIDPQTYCLDARCAETLKAKITPRTRAIIPVHLYGCPADLDSVLRLAADHNLKIIEDNAQAFGAEYFSKQHGARKTGTLGHAGCLSFFPTKNLGAYGDGGMVVTNDDAVAETVRKLRNHGGLDKHVPEMIGWNSRLDELQAAILLVKLRYVDSWNKRRRAIASQYRKLMADLPIQQPVDPSYGKHVYHLYVIRSPERDRVKAHLDTRNIGSTVYYPLPLHRTEPYSQASSSSMPEAEKAARETLALPMFPEMTDEQIEAVAAAVREAVS